ncbi:MAG: hypothetical protein NDP13_01250 [Crenarchaeota archaeon]|nr:hypothetical protein [Thermoproteota archaeon]MCR8501913.1 hypothetical protein [Thermoproteota archaeon]
MVKRNKLLEKLVKETLSRLSKESIEKAKKALEEALRWVKINYPYASAEEVHANRLTFMFKPESDIEDDEAEEDSLTLTAILFELGADYYDEVSQIIFEMIYATEYKRKHGVIKFGLHIKWDPEVARIARKYQIRYLRSVGAGGFKENAC